MVKYAGMNIQIVLPHCVNFICIFCGNMYWSEFCQGHFYLRDHQ
jgi:hypothetical protein